MTREITQGAAVKRLNRQDLTNGSAAEKVCNIRLAFLTKS